MASIMDKLKKNSTLGNSAILSDSKFFTESDMVTTDVPMINVALSGNFDGGVMPGLTVLAGPSKHFKTSFALNVMRNAAIDSKKKIGFFSLEMASEQLAMRLLCSEARVDSNLVRRGDLPKSKYKNLSLAVGPLSDSDIYLGA